MQNAAKNIANFCYGAHLAIFGPGNAPRRPQESSGTDRSHPGHQLRRLLKHSTGTKSELVACAWLSKRYVGNRILECNETVFHPDPARARFSATPKGSLQPSSAFRWFSTLSKHVHGRMFQRTWLAVAKSWRDWSLKCYTAAYFQQGVGTVHLCVIWVAGWMPLKLPIPTGFVCCTHHLDPALETTPLQTKALLSNAQDPHRLAQCNDPCQNCGI